MRLPRIRAAARSSALILLATSAACLGAIRAGAVASRPAGLTVLAALALLAAAAWAAAAVAGVRARPSRISAAAEALAAAGIVVALGTGAWNWATSIQGAILVPEKQPVRLWSADDVVDLEVGPLADRRELQLTLGLARLELRAAGADGFRPVSHVKILDTAGEEVGVEVSRGAPGVHGALLLRQGAFGFAPRVIVARGQQALLDAYVPFRTVREGAEGISFTGEFAIAAEGLELTGAVTLDELGDDMKGHPRLELQATKDGRSLGAGRLSPGDVAVLGEGFSVAFGGLRRWSEIDFARRTHPLPLLSGAAAFALGLALWGVAAWRRW
jgi:hypothetical protein